MHISKHLFTLGALAALVACGGGSDGDDDESNSSRFVTWNSNANGVVIKDAANESFGVESQSRLVVHISRNIRLNDLSVNSNSQVLAKGALIGSVIMDSGTNGTQIAIFKCSSGTVMRLEISDNGSSSHNCTNPPAPSPSPAPAPAPAAQSANQCVRLGRNQSGSSTITNICNVKIWYTFCTLSGHFACRAQPASYSPSGYVYSTGADELSPGNTHITPETRNTGIFVFACVYPRTAYITDFSTPSIREDSTPYGICR